MDWKERDEITRQLAKFDYLLSDPSIQELQQVKLAHDREIVKLLYEKEQLYATSHLNYLRRELTEKTTEFDWTKIKSTPYDANRGLLVSWKCIQFEQDLSFAFLELSFCIFAGAESYQKVLHYGPQKTSIYNNFSFSLLKSTHYFNLPATSDIRIICIVRKATNRDFRNSIPVGWTSIDVFDNGMLQNGDWKIRLYPHPIDFEVPVKAKTFVKDALVFFTICDSAYGVNAEKRVFGTFPDDFIKFASFGTSLDILHEAPVTVEPPVGKKGVASKAEEPKQVKVEHKQNLKIPLFGLFGQKQAEPKPTPNEPQKPEQPEEMEVVEETLLKENIEEEIEDPSLFSFGVQMILITDLSLQTNPKVRLSTIDNEKVTTIEELFTSTSAELGLNDLEYGWVFSYFFESKLQGLTGRKGVFNIVINCDQDSPGESTHFGFLELFKYQIDSPIDINDGLHTVVLKPKGNQAAECKLQVRIYKPGLGLARPVIQKFIPRLIVPEMTETSWISISEVDTEKGEKIQEIFFSIDAARFLPENTLATKIVSKIYNPTANIWKAEMHSTPVLDSLVLFPEFRTMFSIKTGEIEAKSILVVYMYTIDRYKNQKVLAGTSIMDIYKDGKERLGAFQLPIWSALMTAKELKGPISKTNFGCLPCATLLLRISSTPISEKAPIYSSRAYISLPFSEPAQYEKNLYPFVSMQRKACYLKDRVVGMEKYRDDELLVWAKKILENQNAAQLIEKTFICSYDPRYGFKLSIDCGSVSAKNLTIAVTSLSVIPFILGRPLPKTTFPDDLMYTKYYGPQSLVKYPVWNDGFVWYRERQMSSSLVAHIQVFQVSLEFGGNIESVGWTILPIFSSGFVKHGKYRLALFKNSPSARATQLWVEEGVKAIDMATQEGVVTLEGGSIDIQICDGRREEELMHADLSYEFLGAKASKYQSKAWKIPFGQGKVGGDVRGMYSFFVENTLLPYIP